MFHNKLFKKMLESINCPSCGASNQFPEGKTSMFCAFCGNSIFKPQSVKSENVESSIKVKPEISQRKIIKESKPKYDMSTNTMNYVDVETVVQEGGELSLTNRGINNLNEVTSWFSDNELGEVTKLNLSKNYLTNIQDIQRFSNLYVINLSHNLLCDLDNMKDNDIVQSKIIDLSNNKLNSIKNISKFKAKELNLSNNQLIFLDDINQLLYNDVTRDYSLEINLSNNDKLQLFNDNVFDYLNTFTNKISSLTLNLIGCNEFELICLSKLNLAIIKTVIFVHVNDNLEFPVELINRGFSKFSNEHMPTNGTTWRFTKLQNQNKNVSQKKSGNCFIATATMGSYDHPEVMELRNFRDNWILEKSWGERFVKWYYHYGQIASKLIEKSKVLKKISYILIVKPLVFISRLVK